MGVCTGVARTFSLGGVAMASPTENNACTTKESKKQHVYDACVKQRDVCQTFLDEDNKAGFCKITFL